MSILTVTMYGVRSEDIEWLRRDANGKVDLKINSKGNEARLFLDPEVVRMIAAVAKWETDEEKVPA